MRLKKTILGVFIATLLLTQAGCSLQKKANDLPEPTGIPNSIAVGEPNPNGTGDSKEVETTPIVGDKAGDFEIMSDFDAMISDENVKLLEVIAFIKNQIAYVSPENASSMLMKMEELQIKNQTKLEKEYLPEAVQVGFQNAFKNGIDVNQPKLVDASHQALVQETRDSGFKIEQAEGSFYPVMDYSIYKEFSPFAAPDITGYLDIMAEESENVFAKDASLLIGWDGVVKRVLTLEDYLKNYGDSSKAEVIKNLFDRYERIALLGIDNTPLFDYNSKLLNKDARKAYEDALAGETDSNFLKDLKAFMEIVKKNDYQLTEEVKQYQDQFKATME